MGSGLICATFDTRYSQSSSSVKQNWLEKHLSGGGCRNVSRSPWPSRFLRRRSQPTCLRAKSRNWTRPACGHRSARKRLRRSTRQVECGLALPDPLEDAVPPLPVLDERKVLIDEVHRQVPCGGARFRRHYWPAGCGGIMSSCSINWLAMSITRSSRLTCGDIPHQERWATRAW